MDSPSPTMTTRWYVLKTLVNKEDSVKRYLNTYLKSKVMDNYIFDVLVPTETVSEVKNGKKISKVRKFYPGYVFIKMSLYDENGTLLQDPLLFIKDIEGVSGFLGGNKPVALKDSEIDSIIKQVKEAEGKEVPKVRFTKGEEIKITNGPFLNLNGTIDEIDSKRGKLKVSVSIFGRFTPVELEFWQVEHIEKS